jgi:aspartyl-tRNA(Asn)/glutamyl-tRNA(Gln) amidotransferase subunit C
MITKEDIQNLADLARIEVGQEEIERFRSSIEDILGYISEVRTVSGEEVSNTLESGTLRNVFREDTVPHEAGQYTEGVLANAPDKDLGYVKVKKIL